jgi:hypothetical protein
MKIAPRSVLEQSVLRVGGYGLHGRLQSGSSSLTLASKLVAIQLQQAICRCQMSG